MLRRPAAQTRALARLSRGPGCRRPRPVRDVGAPVAGSVLLNELCHSRMSNNPALIIKEEHDSRFSKLLSAQEGVDVAQENVAGDDPAPASGERDPYRISREPGDFEHIRIGYIAGAGLERVAIPRPGSRVIIRRPP